MTYYGSVAHAMESAEVRKWTRAREMFWASTGEERAYWRDVWRDMIRAERKTLARNRATLAAAVARAAQRRVAMAAE